MNRQEVIQSINNRLDGVKAQSKLNFNPCDVDVKGDIVTFKIALCTDDEDGRNRELIKGGYYEIYLEDEFMFHMRGHNLWHPKRFFTDVEVICFECMGDFYVECKS